jgi:hypothetical protein
MIRMTVGPVNLYDPTVLGVLFFAISTQPFTVAFCPYTKNYIA